MYVVSGIVHEKLSYVLKQTVECVLFYLQRPSLLKYASSVRNALVIIHTTTTTENSIRLDKSLYQLDLRRLHCLQNLKPQYLNNDKGNPLTFCLFFIFLNKDNVA